MATKTLAFYQIYYKDEQRDKMYPFSTPILNTRLTDYFENTVIENIVPETKDDLIAVTSWRLADKRHDCFRLTDKTLTSEKILSADFDIAILTPRSPSHRALLMASHWHGAAWDNAFMELKKFIKTPAEVTHAIYENHFIARKEIYHDYVNQCLTPCMDFMRDRPVFFADSGYIKRKSGKEKTEIQAILARELNRKDYPIAPFILERLFSIWIEGKGFKVIPL